jgi:membrane-associated phospholipid phosphatase
MFVGVGYFAYLAMLASVSAVPGRQRAQVVLGSAAVIAAMTAFGMPHLMPLVYLLVGYWLPARLVAAPKLYVEKWLLGIDHRLFGHDIPKRFSQLPRALIEYLELSYLLCYAVVPAGFAWLVLAGFREEADQFWSVVLLSAFLCYGLLPLLPTRAPRALEGERTRTHSSVRRLNLAVLGRASVQWNTFPSGHTAASLATALAVGVHVPEAGIVLGIVAVSIAVGSVVGRDHNGADAIAGAVVALLAFLTASVLPAP